MRFLLLSDTHGRLGIINVLAEQVRADAVIHAGDFGFYDDGSYGRLSHRELRLLIVHSDLPRDEKNRILELPPEGQVTAAMSHSLAGDFQDYIDGASSLSVPIYAVWGNHEDKEVVERLFRGDLPIPNLNILHHEALFHAGDALIYGLGGNLLPGAKMLQKPIAGGGGRVWSTLSQYADLVRMTDRELQATGLRIFVSHVSPGKEPFIETLGARTGAGYAVSGHMGAPTCMVWNPFTIQTIENTLVFASEAGMLEHDLRVLGVLVQWIEEHGARINVDRLARAVSRHAAPRVRAFWAAVGAWLGKDRRLARLAKSYTGPPVDLLPTGTDFQIARRGEDERFASTCLRLPAGTLRKRKGDVLSPVDLARLHAGYRNRILMGPSWRADVWTVLERDPNLSVAQVARRAYCAFATAWQVKRDFDIFTQSGAGRGRRPATHSKVSSKAFP